MNGDRSLIRILRIGIALGIAGAGYIWVAQNARNAAGFLAGTSLSLLSFHSLRRLGEGLQPGAPPLRGSAAFFGFRYALIGAGAYVIVKLLGISVVPVLEGLLVTAAAVLAEILYELVSSK